MIGITLALCAVSYAISGDTIKMHLFIVGAIALGIIELYRDLKRRQR